MKNKLNKNGEKPMAWTELNNKKPETEVENRKNASFQPQIMP